MPSIRLAFLTACLSAGCAFAAQAAEWTLTDGAQVHPPYHGRVPAHSDVVMTSRFTRPEAPAMAKTFGATRVEWVRSKERDFTTALRGAVPWIGYSINASSPLPTDAGTARNFDDEKLIPAAKQTWGRRWWITTTHPETQASLAAEVRQYLDLGANSIQVDEPVLQYYNALLDGGDFNPSTQQGFVTYLANHPDKTLLSSLGLLDFKGNYRDYLKARHKVVDSKDYKKRFRSFPSTPLWLDYIQGTVEAHFVRLRKMLDEKNAGRIPISMNLSNLYEPSEDNRYFFLAPHADYAMPETHIKDIVQLYRQSATARALGIGFVPSIRPLTVAENRVAIADLYAMGGQPLVPWDTYVGVDDDGKAERYFGTEAEYGDLFHFVRANPALFDKFESVALVGVVVAVDAYRPKPTQALVARLVAKGIPFAFVPVGGTKRKYEPDPVRLAKFKLLVTTNRDEEYATADLRRIESARVPRINEKELTEAGLGELAPFVAAPGAEKLRLYARAIPGDRTQLAVHVVDASRGNPAAPAPDTCRRRIGISEKVLDASRVVGASWVTFTGRTELKPAAAGRGMFVTLPSCPVWGVLELKLKG